MAMSACSLVTMSGGAMRMRVRTAAQQQHAALERQLDDLVALGAALRLGLLVGDDFDADHQAASAHIAHQVESRFGHSAMRSMM